MNYLILKSFAGNSSSKKKIFLESTIAFLQDWHSCSTERQALFS